MTQLLLEDLNPALISQLENLARTHGHSLQEEIKCILQQSIRSQLRFRRTGGDRERARETVAKVQAMYARQAFSDSAELIREDRER